MSSTLVTTAELAAHPEWRVFDCRHDLLKHEWGLEEYRKGHLPGALFAHMEHDLSAPKTGKNGRHPLPQQNDFIHFIEKSGIRPSDQIVCYDQGPGSFAARLWWMLRSVGHASVAVLDGGLGKWLKEGRPVTAEVPSVSPSIYKGRADFDRSPDVRFVEKNLQKMLLLDARAPARFRGEQEPIDPVAGRIPGALNRFNSDNMNADGTFKGSEELRKNFLEIIGTRSPADVVNYCGSGVAACHNLLAMEIAGLRGAKLYAGSWSEWIADPQRPRATGKGI